MQETTQNWEKIRKNRQLTDNFFLKGEILATLRDFFQNRRFLEVDTPTLVVSPDPSPFNEVFKIEGEDLYLAPSPEFNIKKLLSSGLKNVYQIVKAYRNWQENDSLHLAEFTILEWYRNEADYFDLMKDCENLVSFVWERLYNQAQSVKRLLRPRSEASKAQKLACQSLALAGRQNLNLRALGKTINYQRQEISLAPPWCRISCKEAFKKYARVDLDEFLDIKSARKICRQNGYQVSEKNSWEELYHQIFLNEVEPKLPKEQPLILYDYPAPLAALSKIKDSDPRYAERFEFYIGGLELGNGYSELTDWQEQEKRLKADLGVRKAKGMKVFDYDHEFVEALKEGMPKTAGIAVGVDRLVMLFADSGDIREVTPLAV